MHSHFSVGEILYWNLGPEAAAAMTLHANELLRWFAQISNFSMIVGFVGGLAAAWCTSSLLRFFSQTETYASIALRVGGAEQVRDAD